MTYKEATSYIHSLGVFGSRLGLERIAALCHVLGDPQDSLGFIHVAGTNGKGSVTAMLSSMLRAQGRRVGMYTSPFLLKFNERIKVNGKDISDRALASLVGEVREKAEALDEQITEFEFITALAFLYFYRQKCDTVVLEVGLGGRFDATNIIKKPLISVITGIALDHTAVLGDTAEKIAFEKAGIIKPGVPVLYGEVDGGAADVIRAVAGKVGAPVCGTDFSRLSDIALSADGSDFMIDGFDMPFHTDLAGEFQPRNAMTAVTAAQMLGVPEKYIYAGLSHVEWKARFETLMHDPTVIYDGAHNPQGAAAAVRTLNAVCGGRKVILFTGMMRDKDCAGAAAIFSRAAQLCVCVRVANPRSADPADLAKLYTELGVEARAFDNTADAVRFACSEAKKRGLAVFAAGSLYMYAEFTACLEAYRRAY